MAESISAFLDRFAFHVRRTALAPEDVLTESALLDAGLAKKRIEEISQS
jgi:hypothetical protein